MRAELEHARDISKGEVPNQAEKHFSRYEGLNEGEVAPSYVYKKAQGKAKAAQLMQYQPINKEALNNYQISTTKENAFGIENIDKFEDGYEPYIIHAIKNNEGQNLGHIRITNNNYIDWSKNNEIEKGAVRKLIAKLLLEGQYPNLIWEATTENSVKSYERFVREFPDLVDRVQFIDSWTKDIDIGIPKKYNQAKGDEYARSQSNNAISERTQVLRGVGSPNNSKEISTVGKNEGQDGANKSGILFEGNSAVNERRSSTNIDNEMGLRPTEGHPTQLKLDFSQTIETKQSTNEVVTGIVNGDVAPATKADIETLVSKVEQLEPEISGFKWTDVIENPEKYAQKIEELFTEEDTSGLIEALAKGDDKYLAEFETAFNEDDITSSLIFYKRINKTCNKSSMLHENRLEGIKFSAIERSLKRRKTPRGA